MLTRNMKSMAAGIVASMALMCSLALGQTPISGAISVGAPQQLGELIGQLADSFNAYHNFRGDGTYTVNLTADAVANIKAEIIAGGATGPYDLLISPDYTPLELKLTQPSLVVGNPFAFAEDKLALYSLTKNINAGLPSQLKDTFVIPDPAQDIYGVAAASVLATTPGALVAYARGRIKTSPAVDVALAAIENGDYKYGFVAKSLICRKFDGVETYTEGTYHHIYSPRGPHPYLPIKLKGIKIARTRTAAQDTVLTAFIDFLQGRDGVPAEGGTPLGTGLLQQYCLTPVRTTIACTR